MMKKELLGEALGTLILVFFGCGAVGAAVINGALTSLIQVAVVFGMGVSIAIFASRNLCPAHLNPAVSFAMCISGDLPWKKFIPYSIAQFIGAFVGAIILYLLFQSEIAFVEQTNGIIRGSAASLQTAMMFGEYFPNPDFAEKISIGWIKAMLVEGLGTFVLILVIYKLTERKEHIDNFTPILIGLTVTLLICLLAPYTQGGFNPARDFGPRLFSYFAGWGKVVFQAPGFGFFTVYILGPMLGALLAAMLSKMRIPE